MTDQKINEVETLQKCMYCWELKPKSEMTLEHAIPQFMGGTQASIQFKVKSACKKCNNGLGLYVDARFEKSYLTSLALAEAARFLAQSDSKIVPPLVCIGTVEITPPGILDTELCEWWTGSQGEHVILIRPKSEDFHGYQGGNPITLKQPSANARAYYFFKEDSDYLRSLAEFKSSFKRRTIKKISGTIVEGLDLKTQGFCVPDESDQAVIDYLWTQVFSGDKTIGQVPFSQDFDTRFLCKIALAIGYCLFGEDYLDTGFAKKLYDGLWYRGEGIAPEIPGARPFNAPTNQTLNLVTCDPGAVSLLIIPSDDFIILTININQKHTWTIAVAKSSELPQENTEKLKSGKIIMLFGPKHSSYEMSLPEYLSKKFHPKE